MDEMNVTLHTYSAENMTDINRILNYDRWALDSIKHAEELIQAAKEYRLRLAKRVHELQEMSFHIRTTLKRERNSWTGKIRYFLTTEKVFEDGTAEELDQSIFEGRDRHKAISEFKAMKRQFPGYQFVEDIQKCRWEK